MSLRGKLILLLIILGLSTKCGWSEETDIYSLLKKASAEISARRFSKASVTLGKARDLKGLTEIERTQIEAASARAAMGEGDFQKARNSYNLSRSYSTDDETDDMLRLIGSELFFLTGDYDKALAIVDSITTPYYSVTKTAHKMRALTMLERHEEAVAIADSILSGDANIKNSEKAVILQNRGYALWDKGEASNAYYDLKDAISLIPESSDRLNLLGNLAMIESELGMHSEALQHINEALSGLSGDSPDGITALRKKGEILKRANRYKEADKIFREYFSRERKNLVSNLPFMSASERLNYWTREKERLSRCFGIGIDAELLFEIASFRRLTSLLGIRNISELDNLLKIDIKKIRNSLYKDEAVIEFVRYWNESGQEVYGAVILPKEGDVQFVELFDDDFIYQDNKVGRGSIFDAIYNENKNDIDLLYSDSEIGNALWLPILSVVSDKTKTIYFSPEGIFHIWGIENMPFKGSDRLELHRISSSVLLPKRNKRSVKTSGGKALLIGGLDYNTLPPYSAGVTNGNESCRTNHEASDLFEERMGRTDLFKYLPGTRTEVDSIFSIRNSAHKVYRAHEAYIKKELPAFNIIHIATHGYSLDLGIRRSPEYMNDSIGIDRSLYACGLALTGANISSKYPNLEDGLLSAREICELDLSNVDFVILSACQTAQGDVVDEGAAGLIRGLKNAGVKTILGTLWSVDDRSTMIFMKEFYRLLNEGRSKHEAFIGARSYLKNYEYIIPYRKFSSKTLSSEKDISHRSLSFGTPYYWAPFILIDDF